MKPRTSTTASATVLVHKGVTGNFLVSHLAHELFHASQYTYDFDETDWLQDFSANWAAFRVLQMMNLERQPMWDYLDDFMKELAMPLDADPSKVHLHR